DYQENFVDKADERSCEEYLRDLELEFHERAVLANSKCFIKTKKNLFKKKMRTLNDEEEVSDDEEETQGASPSSKVMTLTYQDHSLRERSGLGTMKHTKPENQESSNKNVSGPVTISNIEPVTTLVPIEEPKYVSLLHESSKSVNSSKQSLDSKPNGKNADASKPDPLLHEMQERGSRTSNHEIFIASLKNSQNYKAQNIVVDVFKHVLSQTRTKKTNLRKRRYQEEDDMEVDIKEDENDPQLTYPYEEVDPLNPSPPASKSEPDDEIEVENPMEHEDETIPASVYEVGESSTTVIPREDGDSLLPDFMRQDIDSLSGRMANFSRRLCGREMAHALVEKKGKEKDKFYGKLILYLGNEVRSSVEQGTAAMEKLVEKLGNTEDKVECKKLKKELKEARLSNTFLRMQNERVERDLYWTRVRAHEFYQEMIRRGFVCGERPNKATNVPIKDEKSPLIMPPKSAPITQAAICRMIKESVDAAIAVERARQANVKNDASGSGPVRGQDTAPAVCECTFAGFMKCNHAVFCGVEGATEMKQLMTVEFCPIKEVQRMEHELWNLKVKEYDVVAYTQSKGAKVTSSKPADLNEDVRMAHKLMEQKSQARDARILEGKKRKWENLQRGNSSGKGNQRDNSRQTLQNSQKQGNARAMVIAPTNGKLPLCERCFTRHVGQCTIKCHKCEKVRHKARYCKEKSIAMGDNAQPVWTCYDCGEQGSDRSFVNTRFSSLLDIKPIKIEHSYEVELADGRIVSTNTVLKGCTLSLVNHVFKIDLMSI
ncbi:hypothetical protein Tco_1240166, partial [Tanacetum coccineum]